MAVAKKIIAATRETTPMTVAIFFIVSSFDFEPKMKNKREKPSEMQNPPQLSIPFIRVRAIPAMIRKTLANAIPASLNIDLGILYYTIHQPRLYLTRLGPG
jgi:hypothetical protein